MNASRVWQDGWSLMHDIRGFTEMILSAEAGAPEMAFYSQVQCFSDISSCLSPSNEAACLDFLHFSTSLKEERSGDIGSYTGQVQTWHSTSRSLAQRTDGRDPPGRNQRLCRAEGLMAASLDRCSHVCY